MINSAQAIAWDEHLVHKYCWYCEHLYVGYCLNSTGAGPEINAVFKGPCILCT